MDPKKSLRNMLLVAGFGGALGLSAVTWIVAKIAAGRKI